MPIILMTRRFAHQVNKLDGTLRSRVLAFMAKIQTGRPGLNIESLKNAADPRVRTARVDLNHRAVMIQAGADVYGLLAVDTHDKANKYAEHVTIGVNTGPWTSSTPMPSEPPGSWRPRMLPRAVPLPGRTRTERAHRIRPVPRVRSG